MGIISHFKASGVRWVAAAALLAASSACGDVVRQGRSPVFLVINSLTASRGSGAGNFSGFLLSDVQTGTGSTASISDDIGQAVLSLAAKNISVEPTTNNQVTIRRYRVDYMRTDGRNVAGVDVPYGFDGAATVTVPTDGTGTVTFEIVRHVAKAEAPLVQLANGANIIDTIATVTLYGTDQVGNAVSVSGTIRVSFGNFADTAS